MQSWILSIMTLAFSATWTIRSQYADIVLKKHLLLLTMLKKVVSFIFFCKLW